jgi:hypothetical protein
MVRVFTMKEERLHKGGAKRKKVDQILAAIGRGGAEKN